MTWQTNIREEMHAANMGAGVGLDFIYLNDAGDDQDPFAAIPAENLERMKSVREKYDPDFVFTELVGGFKLDRGRKSKESWAKTEL